MALFSIFGKKTGQADGSNEATPAEPTRESTSSAADTAAIREQIGQRAQRDLARITAEKIDAIESEIARDILKSPHPKGGGAATTTPDAADKQDESVSTELFHTTLIRVDKETMILFKEDMDE